jgi:hypothetical protein
MKASEEIRELRKHSKILDKCIDLSVNIDPLSGRDSVLFSSIQGSGKSFSYTGIVYEYKDDIWGYTAFANKYCFIAINCDDDTPEFVKKLSEFHGLEKSFGYVALSKNLEYEPIDLLAPRPEGFFGSNPSIDTDESKLQYSSDYIPDKRYHGINISIVLNRCEYDDVSSLLRSNMSSEHLIRLNLKIINSSFFWGEKRRIDIRKRYRCSIVDFSLSGECRSNEMDSENGTLD